jgi:hypothetical protein
MSPDSATTTAARVANLEKRVKRLEQELDMLTSGSAMRTMADSVPYAWGNSPGEPVFKRSTYSDNDPGPYVSHSARLVANLTSSSTVRRTFGEALLLSGGLTALSAGVVVLGQMPFVIVPVTALTSFALSSSLLVMANRTELHRLVSAQDKRKRNQELRIEVSKLDDLGRLSGIDRLFVNGIDEQQVIDLAPLLVRTESLSVHTIGGKGCILTQGQAQRLCQELESMGYATPARGNVGRKLSAKGRAFFRGLAETGDTQS